MMRQRTFCCRRASKVEAPPAREEGAALGPLDAGSSLLLAAAPLLLAAAAPPPAVAAAAGAGAAFFRELRVPASGARAIGTRWEEPVAASLSAASSASSSASSLANAASSASQSLFGLDLIDDRPLVAWSARSGSGGCGKARALLTERDPV
jgi:hypothetical protein